ncbi:MAG TPA: sialidase family protein [Polyangiaceae bacterium]|jgi:hypothetical protein|nr:sialidase family protein [Polyangiaceae bacterium]
MAPHARSLRPSIPVKLFYLALLAQGCGHSSAGGATPTGPDKSSSTDAELTAQGCDLGRAGTTYTAGANGSTATTAGADLVSCFHLTGQGAAETSLVVTNDGTVLYAPTFEGIDVGLLRSHDQGVTWDFDVPKFPDGTEHGRPQPYMYRDPTTDRVFFSTSAVGGASVTYTSDAGATWSFVKVEPDSLDWMKIYAGPPVSSTTVGYPNIVYVSAPTPTSTPISTILPDHQAFYKSLDGGATFQEVSPISLKPADTPGCDPKEWVIAGNGTVAHDGTVYQSFRLCDKLGIAVSRDEGQTWTMHTVPGTSLDPADVSSFGMLAQIIQHPNWLLTEVLAADDEGTLYAVWPDASWTLRFAYSKDHAATWSTPIVVQAPGVTKSVYGAIAVKSPGHIAISYHGSVDGMAYDGYVAESANALDAAPAFATITVNDSADPLFSQGFDSGYAGTLSGGDLDELINVKYAPNGDLWASFVEDMCPGVATTTDNCTWDVAAHANTMFQGAIGRVVHH